MSREMITLSAEVEEVLRDVARRPGSGLLRVPRKDVARTVLERGAVAHARAAGMSAAERHLVMAHREEVAFVLRQAAYLMICEDAVIRDIAVNRAISGLRMKLTAQHELRVAASDLMRSSDSQVQAAGALDILGTVVNGDLQRWPTLGQVAAAAHRLVPSQSSRLNAAINARLVGNTNQSVNILREVLNLGGTDAVRAMALTNLSDSFLALRDPRRGLQAARRANMIAPHELAPCINQFLCAVTVEDLEVTRMVLARLNTVALTTEMSAFLQARGRWRNGVVPLSSHAFVFGIARDTGPLAEEWIHALIDS